MVLFPLKYNGDTLGYMWATNFDVENTVKIKETLELTTFFLAAEIANYQLLERLEMLSSVAMRLADQEMYAEKRDYYITHPDRRSR